MFFTRLSDKLKTFQFDTSSKAVVLLTSVPDISALKAQEIIKEAIKKADFISLDTEFTGLGDHKLTRDQ